MGTVRSIVSVQSVDGDVPIDIVAKFMDAWKNVATLLEGRIRMPKGCYLSWVVFINPADVTNWNAHTVAQIVRDIRVSYNNAAGNPNYVTSAPIIEVGNIDLYTSGKAAWDTVTEYIEEGGKGLKLLITALNTGKLEAENRHHLAHDFTVNRALTEK